MARLALTNEAAKYWLDSVRANSSGQAYWRLFKSTFTPTCGSTKANFDSSECAFDGYAAVQVALTSTAYDYQPSSACGARHAVASAHFQYGPPADPPNTDIAGGAYLTNYAQDKLLGYVVFDSPVTFDSEDDTVDVHYDLCLQDGCGAEA